MEITLSVQEAVNLNLSEAIIINQDSKIMADQEVSPAPSTDNNPNTEEVSAAPE